MTSGINQRFRKLREELNKTQTEWADIIGLSRSGIADIEAGRRNVTDKHIKLLCIEPIQGKYVNESWLRNGEGEMFKERSPSEEVGYYVEDLLEYDGIGNPFYDMIIEMMKKYSELDDKSKTVIREYFRGVADGIHKEKQEG